MSSRDVQTVLKNHRGITIEEVKRNEKIKSFIEKADYYLGVLGYTEHGLRHCSLAANIAHNIMVRLGKSEQQAQLAAIAAYMHDIGNVVNREFHAQSGAVLAFQLLTEMGMPLDDVLEIAAAIGNHDEKDGSPVNETGAVLILADKSDVHRSRVRTLDSIKQDIHDRVNYAATSSFLRVEAEKKTVQLEIKIDNSISSVMEYFEIFLSRMVVCRRAAQFLGMRFEIEINGHRLL